MGEATADNSSVETRAQVKARYEKRMQDPSEIDGFRKSITTYKSSTFSDPHGPSNYGALLALNASGLPVVAKLYDQKIPAEKAAYTVLQNDETLRSSQHAATKSAPAHAGYAYATSAGDVEFQKRFASESQEQQLKELREVDSHHINTGDEVGHEQDMLIALGENLGPKGHDRFRGSFTNAAAKRELETLQAAVDAETSSRPAAVSQPSSQTTVIGTALHESAAPPAPAPTEQAPAPIERRVAEEPRAPVHLTREQAQQGFEMFAQEKGQPILDQNALYLPHAHEKLNGEHEKGGIVVLQGVTGPDGQKLNLGSYAAIYEFHDGRADRPRVFDLSNPDEKAKFNDEVAKGQKNDAKYNAEHQQQRNFDGAAPGQQPVAHTQSNGVFVATGAPVIYGRPQAIPFGDRWDTRDAYGYGRGGYCAPFNACARGYGYAPGGVALQGNVSQGAALGIEALAVGGAAASSYGHGRGGRGFGGPDIVMEGMSSKGAVGATAIGVAGQIFGAFGPRHH